MKVKTTKLTSIFFSLPGSDRDLNKRDCSAVQTTLPIGFIDSEARSSSYSELELGQNFKNIFESFFFTIQEINPRMLFPSFILLLALLLLNNLQL